MFRRTFFCNHNISFLVSPKEKLELLPIRLKTRAIFIKKLRLKYKIKNNAQPVSDMMVYQCIFRLLSPIHAVKISSFNAQQPDHMAGLPVIPLCTLLENLVYIRHTLAS